LNIVCFMMITTGLLFARTPAVMLALLQEGHDPAFISSNLRLNHNSCGTCWSMLLVLLLLLLQASVLQVCYSTGGILSCPEQGCSSKSADSSLAGPCSETCADKCTKGRHPSSRAAGNTFLWLRLDLLVEILCPYPTHFACNLWAACCSCLEVSSCRIKPFCCLPCF